MRDLLDRLAIPGFDSNAFIDRVRDNASALPNIGIAFSGGGWRALMNGAGALKAFDSRTEDSTNAGGLGGLLQSATYIAGLSGGSWLVGSIYVNNFTTVAALQADEDGSVWEFGQSVLEGPESSGIQLLSTADYYTDIVDEVESKSDAGFNTSLTDLWGRGLSYQLINATGGGPSYTWSSIALTDNFRDADVPFPLVVALARAPGEQLISLNASVYEFNPFELGTWDPTTFGFVPLEHIGTNMTNGSVTDGAECAVGFDNAGFVMGTSSSLFNQVLLNLDAVSEDIPESILNLVEGLLSGVSEDDNDIADYQPNPFFGYNPDSNPNVDADGLTLVDGGEDLQNIPLHPLIQPNRAVDVIFAVDSSADTSNWPNGTALVATYERQFGDIANGTAFPSIPDQNTFVNQGLNNRPTFFGCNATNFTSSSNESSTIPPLVVYIPNAPYVAFSNVSTFQLSTNNTQRDAIIANGYNVATMANATLSSPDFASTWPQCVACAIVARSLQRSAEPLPQACTQCFENFCWDGTRDSQEPEAAYEPALKVPEQEVDIESAAVRWGVSGVGVAVAAVVGAVALL
jgi:lysophospholipase